MRVPLTFRLLGLLFAVALAAPVAEAQTDVAASLYGSFPGTTSGNGVVQSPSNSAGVLLELRHISNPLVGYELTYQYNRANQSYRQLGPFPLVCPPSGCPSSLFQSAKARAQQVGANWVVSVPVLNMKVFGLAGAGLRFFSPDGSQSGTSGETKPVFVYGAGLDYTVIPHLGLRFQYRGNLYHAPALLDAIHSSGQFVHSAEPMLGAYLRF